MRIVNGGISFLLPPLSLSVSLPPHLLPANYSQTLASPLLSPNLLLQLQLFLDNFSSYNTSDCSNKNAEVILSVSENGECSNAALLSSSLLQIS